MSAATASTLPAMEELEGHRLLAGLPVRDRRRIAKKLRLVLLEPDAAWAECQGTIRDVYFPLSAVFSLTGTTSEGQAVEIGYIGCEGIAGVEVALRTRFCDQRLMTTVVQVPGTALRMDAGQFAEEVDQSSTVNRCVLHYMGFFLAQLQLSVACNRHHSLEQRCARRLLTAQDLSGTPEVQITQHQLAQLLGVSRQSVDRMLHWMAGRNLVELSRGMVRIQDRPGLKELSCRCYRLRKKELNEFLASGCL